MRDYLHERLTAIANDLMDEFDGIHLAAELPAVLSTNVRLEAAGNSIAQFAGLVKLHAEDRESVSGDFYFDEDVGDIDEVVDAEVVPEVEPDDSDETSEVEADTNF
jgi:hypothetical protein